MDDKRWYRILTPGMTLLGIWLGCRLRQWVTGQPAQAFVFEYVDEENQKRYRSVPVSTKLWPALLLAWLGNWQPLSGLLAGLVVGGIVDDRHEAAWVRRIVVRAPRDES